MSRKFKKTECPICLQKKNNNVITECNHTFCDECLVRHLIIQPKCPLCRKICNYQYITKQIQPKRQRILSKKYILPITLNNIPVMREQSTFSLYSQLQRVIANRIIFEGILIICIIHFIVSQVKKIMQLQ